MTLKQAFMNNEKELLMLFYDSYNRREEQRQPFLQDGKVCATDGHMVIRIDSQLCEGRYEEYPGGLLPPNTQSIMPEHTCDIAVTRQALESTIAKTPGEGERMCPNCDGLGMVTWEFRDYLYERHTMEGDCPVCDGTGKLNDYEVVKYQFDLCGHYFCYHCIKTLLTTMSLLGINYIRLLNDKAEPLLFAAGGVEVLMMPQMRIDNADVVKVMCDRPNSSINNFNSRRTSQTEKVTPIPNRLNLATETVALLREKQDAQMPPDH